MLQRSDTRAARELIKQRYVPACDDRHLWTRAAGWGAAYAVVTVDDPDFHTDAEAFLAELTT